MLKRTLTLFIVCLSPFGAWSEIAPVQTELATIEKKIEVLKERLHQDRLTEMDEEVKGQGYMIGNWNAYGKELELIQKQEAVDKQIEVELKQLEQRRAELLKQTQKTN